MTCLVCDVLCTGRGAGSGGGSEASGKEASIAQLSPPILGTLRCKPIPAPSSNVLHNAGSPRCIVEAFVRSVRLCVLQYLVSILPMTTASLHDSLQRRWRAEHCGVGCHAFPAPSHRHVQGAHCGHQRHDVLLPVPHIGLC